MEKEKEGLMGFRIIAAGGEKLQRQRFSTKIQCTKYNSSFTVITNLVIHTNTFPLYIALS